MAKTDRENRGRSRRPDSSRREESGEEKKGGRSSYKAKRSFTRNKGFREKEKEDSRKRGSSREGGDRSWGDRKKSFDKPAYRDRPLKRTTRGDDEKPFRSREEREDRSSRDSNDSRPWNKDRPSRDRGGEERERRSGRREEGGDREQKRGLRTESDSERARPSRDRGERERPSSRRDDEGNERGEKRSFRRDESDRPQRAPRRDDDERRPARGEEASEGERKSFRREGTRDSDRRGDRRSRQDDEGYSPRRVKHDEFEEGRSFEKQKAEKKKPGHANRNPENEGLTRLNKYLANAGLASRREADTLIQSGAVKVNGVVVDQLGYKIKPGDKVTYGDESVKGERKVYLLLNKPKDYITTVDDPRERKTVMELIKGACRERVYPVGRLDRNTTGILLFTNDGELTTRLTHPKYNVKKVYHVTLDKNLKTTDFQALVDGVELEDGLAKADDLAFVGEGKREVGIEIHSGKNRIVRRMFEHLGYAVIKLDRVVFAGLTKKDLPRGKHRFLTAKEISFLKMIG